MPGAKFACEEKLDRAFNLKRRKTIKRTRLPKKSIVDDNVSPIVRQLKETETWTKDEMHIFPNLPTAKERVSFVYDILPDDATSLDRLWPIAIVQKDSRLRRRLSDKGKESFLKGDFQSVLDYYNEACLYSCSKGLGHTLARRAAFLLQTEDYELGLRDIRIAFELGCLETELMEFLLSHHITDEKSHSNGHSSLDKSHQAIHNPDIPMSEKKKFVDSLRVELGHLKNEKKGRASDDDISMIITKLREFVLQNQPKNNVTPKFEVVPPDLTDYNENFKSFSKSVVVQVDSNKGRSVVAKDTFRVGDLIMVEKPNTLFFCPDNEKLSLLKNHCLNCLRYSKAPLPCENCVVVSFCSEECRDKATATYHRYECKMKLYEMLHFMGDEYIDVFMAIRTITQRPISYFWERKEEIWRILDMEYPEIDVDSEPWESDSIESLLRLMGHQMDIPEEKLMQNSVIAVFFFQALKAANYFSNIVPKKRYGDRRLTEPELLILSILNQVINIQNSNAEPFTRLVSASKKDDVYFQLEIGRKFFEWERIGSCISSSLGLVNHSCDPNAIRFFMGDHIVLVASKHIFPGDEITISYDSVHHENQPLIPRQLQLGRKYYFSCQCRACEDDYCQYDDMPDKLYHVPNFDSERHFKIRTGDKKDLVSEVDRLKLKSEADFRRGLVTESLTSLRKLSELLEEHIVRPHQYHAQANQAARLCIKMLYLRQAVEEIKDVDFAARIPPNFAKGVKVARKVPLSAKALEKLLETKELVDISDLEEDLLNSWSSVIELLPIQVMGPVEVQDVHSAKKSLGDIKVDYLMISIDTSEDSSSSDETSSRGSFTDPDALEMKNSSPVISDSSTNSYSDKLTENLVTSEEDEEYFSDDSSSLEECIEYFEWDVKIRKIRGYPPTWKLVHNVSVPSSDQDQVKPLLIMLNHDSVINGFHVSPKYEEKLKSILKTRTQPFREDHEAEDTPKRVLPPPPKFIPPPPKFEVAPPPPIDHEILKEILSNSTNETMSKSTIRSRGVDRWQ